MPNEKNSKNTELRIVLFGASGRMGTEILGALSRLRESGTPVRVVGGIVASDDPQLGKTVPGLAAPLTSEWQQSFDEADVIIDFSSPAGAAKAIATAAEHGISLLECTTGLSPDAERLVVDAARRIPVVRARNTSIGVNVLARVVNEAARMLGTGFEAEVVEIHHRHKKDAPSGTAVLLAEEVAKARAVPLSSVASEGRAGISKEERRPEEIGIQAVRGGDVAGEHTVYFFSEGERIELTHRATSRRIFADGAVRAALWLRAHKERGGKAGLYGMQDVLKNEP